MDWVLNSVLGGGVCAIIVFFVLCVWCQRRQRRHLRHPHLSRRHLPSPGSQRQQHVCDELGQRFASVDSV